MEPLGLGITLGRTAGTVQRKRLTRNLHPRYTTTGPAADEPSVLPERSRPASMPLWAIRHASFSCRIITRRLAARFMRIKAILFLCVLLGIAPVAFIGWYRWDSAHTDKSAGWTTRRTSACMGARECRCIQPHGFLSNPRLRVRILRRLQPSRACTGPNSQSDHHTRLGEPRRHA